MSTCTDVGSFIESKTTVVQTSNVGLTSKVSDYLVVDTGPGHCSPVGPLLLQLCFSVSPPPVARPASLPLPLQNPGQDLACCAGCWLTVGVPDPAPLPPQYLHGHWFLSRSLPQIFISDLLLQTDFVDAPHTGVED